MMARKRELTKARIIHVKQYPAEAEELFQAAEDNAKWRYNSYKRMEKQWSND